MGLFGKKRERVQEEVPTTQVEPTPARKRGPSISTIIIVVVMVIGAGIIAYPTFSDWWNSYHQSRAIAGYVMRVQDTDPELLAQMMEEAKAYNERLASDPNRYIMTDEELAEYNSILNIDGSGVMGYIQMNRLGINYPIYHGVDESILQIAIGHIEGSSFPVGGPTTHAAVSGHRGLPRAKLFTDLDKVVEGDTFTITVLDETLTYEVDQIRIVEPSDMSDLNIEAGADYVTLITCTPYGINTHRLLVRGHRVENAIGSVAIPAEAVQIPNYVAVPAVAVPMLFVYLLGTLAYYHFKSNGYDKDQVMAELEELKDESTTEEDELTE